MTPKQVVAYYGSQAQAAEWLCVSPQVVNNWVKRNQVPLDWQIFINRDTGGKLKLDRVASPAQRSHLRKVIINGRADG